MAGNPPSSPHVARLGLPLGVKAEVVWDPDGGARRRPDGSHAERWKLRWCTAQSMGPLRLPGRLEGPVCSIGLNPSGAGDQSGDMTLNTEWALYGRWGRTELVKLNLFPAIATIPFDLVAHGSGDPAYVDYVLAEAIAAHRAGGLVIATWGGPYHPTALGRLVAERAAVVVQGLQRLDVPLHVLGLTKGQQPRHIRGIGRDVLPQPWRPA